MDAVEVDVVHCITSEDIGRLILCVINIIHIFIYIHKPSFTINCISSKTAYC